MSPDNPHGAPSPAEISVHLVGTDELKSRAAEVSERRLEEKLAGDDEGRLRRSRAVVRRIWYGNMAREHYLSKYSREAREEIKESGNLYTHAGLDKQAHDEAMDATVMRFALESDDYIHEGEERGGGLEGESGQAVKTAIQDVIKAYARGDLTSEAFEEEKNRVMAELGKQYPDVFEEARLYADNLVGVAEAVKNQVQAGEDLDRVVEDVKFYVEKARTGVRTEAQLNAVDRLMDKLNDHHVFTNDAFVAGAVSIAYSVARYSARTTAGVLFKMAVIPGLSTGVMAGLTEKGRIKKERRHHMRERAQGAHFAPDAERREELEKTRYDTVSAMGLADQLHQEFTEVDAEGRVVERDMTDEEYNLMLDTLSDAMARVRMSDQKDVDLLDYSSIETVEHERLTLDLRIAQAKIALQNQLGGRRSLDASLDDKITTKMEALSEDIENKDLIFRKLKRGAVAKAVAKGVILGATFGTISHELLSVVRPDEHGLLDSVIHHDKPAGAHQTLLRHMILGDHHKQILDSSNPHVQPFGDGSHMVNLPDNVHLRPGGNGGYAIEGPGHQVIADHINFSSDGSLDDPSKAMLDHMGITSSSSLLRAPSGVVAEHSVSTGDYVAHHAEKMTHFKRDGWSDNDTPMHYDAQGRLVGADQNELRVLWGGSNGSGIDEQGNYVLDVSHMTSDGSFHAGVGVDAASEMQSGRLVAMVSASKDSQQLAFETHINTQGQLVIDHGSDPGHLFQTVDGHAQFNGAYIEIAKINGVEDGITHVNVLATHVGENAGQVTDTVPGPDISRYVTTLRNFPRASSARPLVDVPWMVPQGRKGLETAMKRIPDEQGVDNGTPSTPEGPQVQVLSLFEIKELARHNVAKLKELGDITAEERGLIAANLGRITQHMKAANRLIEAREAGKDTSKMKAEQVSQTDVAALYATFSLIHERHPELISDELLNQVRLSLLDADSKLGRQTNLGWVMGTPAPGENLAKSPVGTRSRRKATTSSSRGTATPTSPVTPPVPITPTGPANPAPKPRRPKSPVSPPPPPPLTPAPAAGAEVPRGSTAAPRRLRTIDPSGRVETNRIVGVATGRPRRTVAERNAETVAEVTPERVREALGRLRETNPALKRAFDLVDHGVTEFRLSESPNGPEIRSRRGVYRVRGADLLNAIQAYISLNAPSSSYNRTDLGSMSRSVDRLLNAAAQPVEASSAPVATAEEVAPPPPPLRASRAQAVPSPPPLTRVEAASTPLPTPPLSPAPQSGEVAPSGAEAVSARPNALATEEADRMMDRISAGEADGVLAELGQRGYWRQVLRDGSPVRVISDDVQARRVWDALVEARNALGESVQAAPTPALHVVPDLGVEEPVDSGRPARRRARRSPEARAGGRTA